MTDSRSRSDPLRELDPGTRLRVRVAGLTAALIAAVAVLFAGSALRQPMYDLFQNISPTPDVSRRVHVVVIDAESLREVGGWPWTRFYLARLVEEISARGAAVIGFDLLFPEPDRLSPPEFANLYHELTPEAQAQIAALPSMDAVFARVVGRSPVVLARAGVTKESFDLLDQAVPPAPPEARFEGRMPSGLKDYPEVLANLPMLDGAALGHGLVNGERDGDGLVRAAPLLARAGGQVTPGLAAELVRIAEGADAVRVESDGRRLTGVTIGSRHVAAGPDGRLTLRFGDWRSTQTTSSVNVLRKGLPNDLFKDQIVLIGLASAGTSDVTSTPRAREIYGVYVQAQAVDAILRGAGLHRPAWAAPAEWLLGLTLVLLSWWGVPRAPMGPVMIGAVAEVAAAVGGAYWAFQNNLMLDPFPVLAPGAANSAVLVTLLFVEGRRVQARLRADLEDERLSAARISGELAAASEIQSGMLLPRAQLARVSPEVEIDAVLEPARTVGGDLYDAFALDDGSVCFLVGDVTGKGVPASLFMALSKALSRSLLLRPGMNLSDAMSGINAELSRDNGQAMAVSLLVGRLAADGALDLCSAGHEHPLRVRRDGTVEELRLEGGPALCVVDDFPYPVESFRLEPGETLVAFTDGLSEAQAPDGRLITREAVHAAVAAAAAQPALAQTVDAIVARVRAFEAGAEPSDDLTVLAVRRRG